MASDEAVAQSLLVDAASRSYDLVVSEVRSFTSQASAVCESFSRHADAPAAIVIGPSSVDSVLAALRLGVADYLTRPVDPAHLRDSALRVLAQRQQRREKSIGQQQSGRDGALPHSHQAHAADTAARADAHSAILVLGDLTIDTARQTIRWQGQLCAITPIEYALLRYLAVAPSTTRSYREIVSWTHDYDMDDQEAKVLLKSHVRNLRRKLGPHVIMHVKGIGYLLNCVPCGK